VVENLVHTVNSGAWLIFVKAVFANYFINASVIVAMQMTEHLAKIVVLMMGVSVFAYMGFEHVVANSALFAAALLEQPESVNIAQMGENFLFSLVGNYGWRWARDRSLLRLPEDHRRDAPHEDLSCAWHKVQSTVDMRRQKRLAPRAHETRPRLGYAHSAVLCEHAYEIGRDQP
jgi:Formate/nitrite transporter